MAVANASLYIKGSSTGYGNVSENVICTNVAANGDADDEMGGGRIVARRNEFFK